MKDKISYHLNLHMQALLLLHYQKDQTKENHEENKAINKKAKDGRQNRKKKSGEREKKNN